MLALALTACAGGTPINSAGVDPTLEASDITALRWLAKGHDQVAFLTRRPVECLTPTRDAKLVLQRDLGRAAFESPALLGGAAARRGVACSSCHINGRGNPDFFVDGLSDQPGTADVTSSLFSKTRGDGDFNPKPIPDLALRDGHQIKDRTSAEFRIKVRGLIIDEFDGQAPPAPVFEDVLAYLNALTPEACGNRASEHETATASRDLDAVKTALAGARSAGSPAEGEFWIRVARRGLERIAERFVGSDLLAVRGQIETLSLHLGEEADAIHSGRAPTPPITAEGWLSLESAVKAQEAKSLYNPVVLKAALAASRHVPGAR